MIVRRLLGRFYRCFEGISECEVALNDYAYELRVPLSRFQWHHALKVSVESSVE